MFVFVALMNNSSFFQYENVKAVKKDVLNVSKQYRGLVGNRMEYGSLILIIIYRIVVYKFLCFQQFSTMAPKKISSVWTELFLSITRVIHLINLSLEICLSISTILQAVFTTFLFVFFSWILIRKMHQFVMFDQQLTCLSKCRDLWITMEKFTCHIYMIGHR